MYYIPNLLFVSMYVIHYFFPYSSVSYYEDINSIQQQLKFPNFYHSRLAKFQNPLNERKIMIQPYIYELSKYCKLLHFFYPRGPGVSGEGVLIP